MEEVVVVGPAGEAETVVMTVIQDGNRGPSMPVEMEVLDRVGRTGSKECLDDDMLISL